MTINDIMIDIISAVSQLTDLGKLRQIRSNVLEGNPEEILLDKAKSDVQSGVTFEDLLREQNYEPVTYEEFLGDHSDENWEVSLDTLLQISNQSK